MKLIIIFGPQAVGKMTVGHALEKITNLKLFHNHMTIDLVRPFLGYGSKSPVGTRLVHLFRRKIFEEFAKSDNQGLIFTYIRVFNKRADRTYVKKTCDIFRKQGGEIILVELEADLDTRRERNLTPHRLEHKPSKRDIERSQKDLENAVINYRMNSYEGEIQEKNYIKINNTHLSPEAVAELIKNKFQL